ncbi:hypothetical protein IFR05_002994 [Cadophora sp. M221]|nr:hypothetical protein IFR05_002994 [Cadophora sp. M221]
MIVFYPKNNQSTALNTRRLPIPPPFFSDSSIPLQNTIHSSIMAPNNHQTSSKSKATPSKGAPPHNSQSVEGGSSADNIPSLTRTNNLLIWTPEGWKEAKDGPSRAASKGKNADKGRKQESQVVIVISDDETDEDVRGKPNSYSSAPVPPPFASPTTRSESPSLFLPEDTPYPKYTSPTPSFSSTQPPKKRKKPNAAGHSPTTFLASAPRMRNSPAAGESQNNNNVEGVITGDNSATKKRKREAVVASAARGNAREDRQAGESPRELFKASLGPGTDAEVW